MRWVKCAERSLKIRSSSDELIESHGVYTLKVYTAVWFPVLFPYGFWLGWHHLTVSVSSNPVYVFSDPI